MTVLLIKILGPVALLCVSVRKRWSKLRDKNTRWRALGGCAGTVESHRGPEPGDHGDSQGPLPGCHR